MNDELSGSRPLAAHTTMTPPTASIPSIARTLKFGSAECQRALSDASDSDPKRPPDATRALKATLKMSSTLRISQQDLATMFPPGTDASLPEREGSEAGLIILEDLPAEMTNDVALPPPRDDRQAPVLPPVVSTPSQRWRWVFALIIFGVAAMSLTVARAANDRRWVAPMVLSSSDPRVIQVATSLQEETAKRGALALQRNELAARLEDTQRWAGLEEAFQSTFKAALRSDLAGQRAELHRLQSLLADRDAFVGRVPNSALDAKIHAVEAHVRLLEAASSGGQVAAYTTLSLRHEYDLSVLAGEQARQLGATLTRALGELDDAIQQKDALLATIHASPYLRAISGDQAMAFVPYETLATITPGATLVACRLMGVVCAAVGTIGEVLPAEVHGSSATGEALRGRLAMLSLSDRRAAERPVLYARLDTSRP